MRAKKHLSFQGISAALAISLVSETVLGAIVPTPRAQFSTPPRFKAGREISARRLQADWMKTPVIRAYSQVPLSNQNFVQKQTSFLNTIFDPGFSDSMRSHYQRKAAEYEYKKNYGLMNLAILEGQIADMKSKKDEIISNTQSYQLSNYGERARKALMKIDELKFLHAPGGMLVGAYIFFNGRPYRLRLSEKTAVSVGTQQGKSGSLGLNSPLFNSGVRYNPHAVLGNYNAGREPEAMPMDLDEQVRVEVSRSVPIIDMGSRVVYGSTTRTLTASVERSLPIFPEIGWAFDRVHPLEKGRANINRDESRVRLNYSVSF